MDMMNSNEYKEKLAEKEMADWEVCQAAFDSAFDRGTQASFANLSMTVDVRMDLMLYEKFHERLTAYANSHGWKMERNVGSKIEELATRQNTKIAHLILSPL